MWAVVDVVVIAGKQVALLIVSKGRAVEWSEKSGSTQRNT